MSDSARAFETASVVCDVIGVDKQHVHKSPLLRERGLGSWEGKLLEDVLHEEAIAFESFPEPRFMTLLDHLSLSGGGEDKAAYLERVNKGCDAVLEPTQHDGTRSAQASIGWRPGPTARAVRGGTDSHRAG